MNLLLKQLVHKDFGARSVRKSVLHAHLQQFAETDFLETDLVTVAGVSMDPHVLNVDVQASEERVIVATTEAVCVSRANLATTEFYVRIHAIAGMERVVTMSHRTRHLGVWRMV